MEITRENQLEFIRGGLAKLGITQHRLEILAKIPVGSIKDLRRGKRAMTADRWQKICNIIETPLKKETPQEEFTQTEIGLMSAIRAIIIILSNYDVIRQNTLKDVFSYQQKDFRMRAQPGAAAVMNQLIEFLNDSPLPETQETAYKPVPPVQGQSKNEKA